MHLLDRTVILYWKSEWKKVEHTLTESGCDTKLFLSFVGYEKRWPGTGGSFEDNGGRRAGFVGSDHGRTQKNLHKGNNH